MGRINRYRDIKDPQLNYFIAENLRDHKDRIKQKQVVMTTEGLNIVTSTNSIDGVTCEDIRTGKELPLRVQRLPLTTKYDHKKHQEKT